MRLSPIKRHLPQQGGSVGWSIIPYTKKVVGSIPGQDTYLGCRLDPRLGRTEYGRQLINVSHINGSLPPMLLKNNTYCDLKKKIFPTSVQVPCI